MVSRRKAMSLIGATGLLAATGAGLLVRRSAAVIDGTSRAHPVISDDVLPGYADVVIIGGGVIGVCTALCLAERGVTVALCEKGLVAGEASGRAAGWIESLYMEPPLIELIIHAKKLWRQMNRRIGADCSFRESGISMLLTNDAAVVEAERWVESVNDLDGMDLVLLNRIAALKYTNAESPRILGALYQPSDGIVEPRHATSILAHAAKSAGATIHQYCAVRGLETKGGRLDSVVTEKGAIRCQRALLAGGVWSSLFCESIGLELPQLVAFTSSMSIKPLATGPVNLAGDYNSAFWRRQSDNGYAIGLLRGIVPLTRDALRYGLKFLPALPNLLGAFSPALGQETIRSFQIAKSWSLDQPSPFEDIRILQPRLDNSILEEALRRLIPAFPAFKDAVIRERWAGALVSTPDRIPVISAIDSLPGLVLSAGFTYGLTVAPAVGELLADVFTGKTPKIDLTPFQIGRFNSG